MDRLLRSASWCPSDRVWHDDAVILLGGTPNWQSRRAGGFDTSERADSVLTSLFMAGAGLAIILVGSSLITVSCGAGLTGSGLAAVFPTILAIFTRQSGRQASQLTGYVFVVGGPGRSADSLAGRIDFGPVWGFTHRTSHSAVLRGIYDCLANFYYPGVGS